MKALNWIIALGGVWSIISSFILGFSNVAVPFWDSLIVGIVLVILGAWAALSDNFSLVRTLSWINAVLGLWLIVSPFILGFSVMNAALWSFVVDGIIVLVLGVWAAVTSAPRVTV